MSLINVHHHRDIALQRLKWIKNDLEKYIKSIEDGTTLHMRDEVEEIRDLTVLHSDAPLLGVRFTLEFYRNNLDSKEDT